MQKRSLFIIVGILGVIVMSAIAWYLISPLFINRTVDEEIPNSLVLETMDAAAAMPDKSMEEDMPVDEQPTVIRSGRVIGADSFHQGSGTATIFKLAGDEFLLRLEDFMVTNGPDLHVLLATGLTPTERSDLGEYVDLGKLKGNVGNQNYEIGNDVDLDRYQSVVIYCLPFHVVFATAGLTE